MQVYFFENRVIYEIIWNNIVERCRLQMTIWRHVDWSLVTDDMRQLGASQRSETVYDSRRRNFSEDQNVHKHR
jgi:hypothetical protein